MIVRGYCSELVENTITNVKNELSAMVKRYKEEYNEEKVKKAEFAILMIGEVEDRIFDLDVVEVEI